MDITLYTDSGKKQLCDFTFPVASSSQNESCTDCDFAWNFILGEATVNLDGVECEFLQALSETEVSYGHAGPGSLYSGKSNVWEILKDGSSTYEDETWEFEFSFDVATEGKDGGDKKDGDGKSGGGK